MIAPPESVLPTISSEACDFALEHGVSAELPVVLEMTHRLFPQAMVSVFVEDDPEIANDRHIVILAKGVNLTVDDAVEATWDWHREMSTCCPAPLVCVFRLGVEGLE